MMRFFKILVKREYVHGDKTHTRWYRVGEMKFTDKGGKYLRLYQFPDTEHHVVEVLAENEDLPTID